MIFKNAGIDTNSGKINLIFIDDLKNPIKISHLDKESITNMMCKISSLSSIEIDDIEVT